MDGARRWPVTAIGKRGIISAFGRAFIGQLHDPSC